MQKKYCSLALYILGQINFSSFSLLGPLRRGADYSEPDGSSAVSSADEGRWEDRSRSGPGGFWGWRGNPTEWGFTAVFSFWGDGCDYRARQEWVPHGRWLINFSTSLIMEQYRDCPLVRTACTSC